MKQIVTDICVFCHEHIARHHSNLRCRIGGASFRMDDSVKWNPYNKVVQSHRDGTIDYELTDEERKRRQLPIPWTAEIGTKEVREAPIL